MNQWIADIFGRLQTVFEFSGATMNKYTQRIACIIVSLLFILTATTSFGSEVQLDNWFSKTFSGPDMSEKTKFAKTNVIGSWGNAETPYFLVILKLDATNVEPIQKEDPFTKTKTVSHYSVSCIWDAYVANAYEKRLAIQSDWNALSLRFKDNNGDIFGFSWNMATGKSTVFPSAKKDELIFPKRIRHLGTAENFSFADNKFKSKANAENQARDYCLFDDINNGKFATINAEGFMVEGEGNLDYSADTVLTVFLK